MYMKTIVCETEISQSKSKLWRIFTVWISFYLFTKNQGPNEKISLGRTDILVSDFKFSVHFKCSYLNGKII